MRQLLIGIDSGTQSTKALVVDARDGKVLGAASQAYDLIPNLPPGAKEQHPHTWRDATAAAIRSALRQAKAAAAAERRREEQARETAEAADRKRVAVDVKRKQDEARKAEEAAAQQAQAEKEKAAREAKVKAAHEAELRRALEDVYPQAR